MNSKKFFDLMIVLFLVALLASALLLAANPAYGKPNRPALPNFPALVAAAQASANDVSPLPNPPPANDCRPVRHVAYPGAPAEDCRPVRHG